MSRGKDDGGTTLPPADPTPWDRLEGETDKAFAAFEVYRMIPPRERSYRATSERLGTKSIRWLKTWGSRYEWRKRVQEWDKHCARVRTAAAEKAHRVDIEELRAELLALHRRTLELSISMLEKCQAVIDEATDIDEETGELVQKIPLSKVPQFARAASAVANTSIEGVGLTLAIDEVLELTADME